MPKAADAALPPLASAEIPRATYRVQLHAGMRFADVQPLIEYLAALGISHLYASPILKARAGSTHGYDTVDPTQLNPEIGSDADFDALCRTLAQQGMQLLLDIVPNHMGVLEADNHWWLDVLEHGPSAAHAAAFDIEWAPPQHELHGKVMLAVLGEPYGHVLEAGLLQPVFDGALGQFRLHYYSHRFPIDPSDYAGLLAAVPLPAEATEAETAQLESLRVGFGRLPPRDTANAVARATRQREAAALKAALAQLHAQVNWAPAWLAACASRLCGQEGDAASYDALDRLLQRQAYRLAHWRAAGDELNYRRFFDINALAALRMEDPAVFDDVHRRVLEWVADGHVAGLRIDHPDGMCDPAGYFQRMQQRGSNALAAVARADRQSDVPRSLYIVVEKILADDEAWRRDWPVHGETGYRYANQVCGLFVDPNAADAFDALYRDFVGTAVDFDAELYAAKRSIMAIALAADLRLLTELAHDIALQHRHTRDLTREGLRVGIVEYAAAHDVYRSYVTEAGAGPLDRPCIEKAAALARTRVRPSLEPYVDFVRRLMLEGADEPDAGLRACKLRFIARLQQFTAPVMAKAMEDTAFYRYHRLVCLNDVGGDPRRFGCPPDAFHAANLARLRDTPATLLGSSTHDSKRSEDVRTRLAVLSEMPQRWMETLARWHELAQTQWHIGSLEQRPTPNDEMLLYQTLVGIWPVELDDDAALAVLRERVVAYMLKAVREAKQQSSWLDENDAYEGALQRCIEALLVRLSPNPFLTDLRRFVADIAPYGCGNSLALVALKLTSPGVPDLYQGCEDWCYSLVDPDNRRPVDFAALHSRLPACVRAADDDAEQSALCAAELPGGLHKLYVTRQLLRWRAAAAGLWTDGDYQALQLTGRAAAHALAYARCNGGACSVTVVPRLAWQLSDSRIDEWRSARCWHDTELVLPALREHPAPRKWIDVITGRQHAARQQADGRSTLLLRELLSPLPVAVLAPCPPAA